MIKPPVPLNEIKRISDLKEYKILDTLPENDFDDITLLASQICNTPISLVSMIDETRQWFKSHHGLDVSETPREISFCAHAINSTEKQFVINDSRKDERFFDNPLVTGAPHVVFYAGVPLLTPKGNALGTLCVIDNKPHQLTADQLSSLAALSKQVMCQLELRKKNQQLTMMYDELVNNYNDIEQFASIAAHDLRSPLHNITSLIDIYIDENESLMSDDSKEYLTHIKTSSTQLTRLIDEILEYSKSTQIVAVKREEIHLETLLKAIIQLLKPPKHIAINFVGCDVYINSSKIALKQIMLNLINNAIKYADKPEGEVNIAFHQDDDYYYFSVADNGPGIPEEHRESIFDLFKTVKIHKNSGTGIGLSIVKRLVKKLSGDITLDTKLGEGTIFSFSIRRQ